MPRNPNDDRDALPAVESGNEEPPSLELKSILQTAPPSKPVWTLVAHDKRVLKGWEQLAKTTPSNVINAFDWLSQRAMTPRGGRCFPLRHKNYAGSWCYELGAGDRLYYKPDDQTKIAKVWYVGPHPRDRIPSPPRDI